MHGGEANDYTLTTSRQWVSLQTTIRTEWGWRE